jgi:hypothetical protein
MLGRLIVPASKLGALPRLLEGPDGGRARPLSLSVLAGIGASEADATAAVQNDVRSIRRLIEEAAGAIRVDAIETKIPGDVATPAGAGRLADCVARFADRIGHGAPEPPELWVEVPVSRDGRAEAGAAIEGIRMVAPKADHAEGGRPRRIGFKLRCGGSATAVVPSAQLVAFVIAACRDAGIPLKCTAGLHHPVRHPAGSTGAESHGFLSVFGAAILAHANGWPEMRIASCVSEEDARAFVFDDGALSWRGESASPEKIARARRDLAAGFGSCSFDEPREDLAALGWLEPIEVGGA